MGENQRRHYNSHSVLIVAVAALLLSACGGDDNGGPIPAPSCENNCPVANAGLDRDVPVNSQVQLDGSQSAAGQLDLLLTYQWTLLQKPTGSAAALTAPTTVRPTFTADVPGAYTAQLVVSNGVFQSEPDTVTITAITGNARPLAMIASPVTGVVGQEVTLDGTNSADPNGTRITYKWRFVTRPPGSQTALVAPTTARPSFRPDVAGRYTVELTVSDGALTSLPAEADITIVPGDDNAAPTAHAGPDQTVPTGQRVTLSGSQSSDPNGDPLRYNWYFRSRPEGSTATLAGADTAHPTFTPDIAGSYVVFLSVTDGQVSSPFDDEVVVDARIAPPPSPTPGWNTVYEEDFEGQASLFAGGPPSWVPDSFQFTDRFADGGAYFQAMGITPPTAFRAETPFGRDGWLTAAAYSRSSSTDLSSLIAITADPAGGANHVLKIASPVHTDAAVVRPSFALPTSRYRVCLKVGFARFGNGVPEPSNLNGYLGGERSEPWFNNDSTLENGFYWLTILDEVPRPHNNVWIHHHRKVVIDSDNNKEAWTQVWTGSSFQNDGRHPVMMFGLDKNGIHDDRVGLPFLSWSNSTLQPSGFIRAVDAYKDNTWYSACIERNEAHFVLSVAGDFRWGGLQTYVGSIPISAVYRAETGIPDFFMFGDPHNNYYRGEVFYDDVKLEYWGNSP